MARDFDAVRKTRQSQRSVEDRTFTIGGEAFVVHVGVHPDVLKSYDDLNESSTASKTLEVVDEFILNMLEGGEETVAKWKRVRANHDDPIELDDLLDLAKWLLETATGRPTGLPGDSTPGPAAIPTTTSTDASSSPDTPEAQTA